MNTPYDAEQQVLEDSDHLTPDERSRLQALRHRRACYIRALTDYCPLVSDLLEAAEAGGRYSDALLSLQDHFPDLRGTFVDSVDLDALFRDWHDKTRAAIKKARLA